MSRFPLLKITALELWILPEALGSNHALWYPVLLPLGIDIGFLHLMMNKTHAHELTHRDAENGRETWKKMPGETWHRQFTRLLSVESWQTYLFTLGFSTTGAGSKHSLDISWSWPRFPYVGVFTLFAFLPATVHIFIVRVFLIKNLSSIIFIACTICKRAYIRWLDHYIVIELIFI